MSIAVIWGNHRNDPKFHTHHSFWEETLKDMGFTVERYTWGECEDMPRGHDAYFFIDFHPVLFGIEPGRFKNSIFYWNDSFHFSFAYPGQLANRFDWMYVAERPEAMFLQHELKQKNVKWMMLAFYPKFYRPLEGAKKVHHYAFIGQQDNVVSRNGDTRHSILRKLSFEVGLRGYIGLGIYGETVNQIYNESKVMFDRTIWYNIGSRIFEVVGSGGFFLMNELPLSSGLPMVGVRSAHYATYDDTYHDFRSQLRFFLEHDEVRERIAESGRKHFLEHHTYEARVREILQDLHLR